MPERKLSKELAEWCNNLKCKLEYNYLSFNEDEPWRQSGMSGPENRWISLRKPIADCVEYSGTFLDIGCANGYLLECIMKWVNERGLSIEPFGLDISEELIKRAKKRLPNYSHNMFEGNCFSWLPPRKFDYVSTMLGYVPDEYEKEYILFLFDAYINNTGKLLVLRTGKKGEPEEWLRERFCKYGIAIESFKHGFDPVLDRQASVAIINNSIS